MNGSDDRLLCVVKLPNGYDKASVIEVARFAIEFSSSVSEHLLVIFQPPTALRPLVDGTREVGGQGVNSQIKQVRN